MDLGEKMLVAMTELMDRAKQLEEELEPGSPRGLAGLSNLVNAACVWAEGMGVDEETLVAAVRKTMPMARTVVKKMSELELKDLVKS